jgi:hypothetical protein
VPFDDVLSAGTDSPPQADSTSIIPATHAMELIIGVERTEETGFIREPTLRKSI